MYTITFSSNCNKIGEEFQNEKRYVHVKYVVSIKLKITVLLLTIKSFVKLRFEINMWH